MPGLAVAIVSGKGGSGKTMLAAEMALQFARSTHSRRIILVDADTGTGGLSLYLSANEFDDDGTGLSTIVLRSELESGIVEVPELLLKRLRNYQVGQNGLTSAIEILPIGDFPSVNREFQRSTRGPTHASVNKAMVLASILTDVISELKNRADAIIVDCRGGVDDESIAVCQAVDDIILVTETDTTAFQASMQLLTILSQEELDSKLKGYVFNKVIADPERVQHIAEKEFKLIRLSTIPFDLSSARAFLLGNIPRHSSIFSTHVQEALSKAYPDHVAKPSARIWRPMDYDTANIFNPTAVRVSVVAALAILSLGLASALSFAVGGVTSRGYAIAMVSALSVLGAVAVSLVTFLRRSGDRGR